MKWWELILLRIFTFFKINRIISFYYYITKRFRAQDFNIGNKRENVAILFRKKPTDGICADRTGRLILLESRGQKIGFFWKNFFLLQAPQKRVERSLVLTFATLSVEIYNPFDRRILKDFVPKKVAFLKRLLKKIDCINGREWDPREAEIHIDTFERSSLLQDKLIQQMESACKREGSLPLVEEGQAAINRGLYPVLSVMGYSGAYWIRGLDRRLIGIFKPFDEEIHAPNNPIGPGMQGALGLRKTRRGCRVGESVHHEVAAFLVDNFLGFGLVPKTYYASFTHRSFFIAHTDPFTNFKPRRKIGSLQEFVEGFTSLSHLSKEERNTAIPVEDFQLLIALDVIIGNYDRNTGNILIGNQELVAIDHGLCFPDLPIDLCTWYWERLEQGKTPLYPSLVDLFSHFPFEALAWKLKRRCFISENALRRMKERIALFRAGVAAKLTPHDLADLMQKRYLYPLVDLDQTLQAKAEEETLAFVNRLNDRHKDLI